MKTKNTDFLIRQKSELNLEINKSLNSIRDMRQELMDGSMDLDYYAVCDLKDRIEETRRKVISQYKRLEKIEEKL